MLTHRQTKNSADPTRREAKGAGMHEELCASLRKGVPPQGRRRHAQLGREAFQLGWQLLHSGCNCQKQLLGGKSHVLCLPSGAQECRPLAQH
jgi:hypothetical protein